MVENHDNNGNLILDGVRDYQWDILSRLTKITWATGKTTEFKYNALGQRCERIDKNGSTVTRHYYLINGADLIDHRSGSTAATATIDRRYFSQGEQRKNGTNWENHFYSRDHLGSIREVVKSVGGTNTLVARYDYDPYGRRLTQYESSTYAGGCDFGFTGHFNVQSLENGQSEMVMTLFRAYDPVLGKWLGADPLGEEGGINLYGYGPNDPINGYDPLGDIWHHMITYAAGRDHGFSESFVNSMNNGIELSQELHDELHYKRGWTKEWTDFFSRNPNACEKDAMDHASRLKSDPRFKDILSKGKTVAVDYPHASARAAQYNKSRLGKIGVRAAAGGAKALGIILAAPGANEAIDRYFEGIKTGNVPMIKMAAYDFSQIGMVDPMHALIYDQMIQAASNQMGKSCE